ncbi:L-seryl-tRNA(Sec) selenium transferase [Clostridium thermopalmarium]|uniref:L-seryl-tRNA(Sec) selenium transferase n=1 Tax=Clostridium thermopalmarium TaxID=29373 RepID=UPI002353F2ED|nr:L-seryl-tRNA(Sec) selenium transferase [Clostridium thermopalmarium]
MSNFDKQQVFRQIPPINILLDLPEVKKLIETYGREFIVDTIRLVVDNFRKSPKPMCREEIIDYIGKELDIYINEFNNIGLKRVINATGVILHTNLGRAPMPKEAINLINEVSSGYSNLEFDLESGGRGSRHSHIEHILKRITGAESAVIVNNNAAAVFLCLNTLANNREVIISRGQQVEIGGSFRIPDIIARSSCKMVEVGTTNKTRLSDYSNAITEETSILLKVHTSNYKITGFTEEVPLQDLVSLGKQKNLIIMEDLGSGSLYDLSLIGLPYEPTVQDSIKNGADIVTFSGDKLLGGSQAGIIVGKKDLIDKIKKNPLMRMLRCDKLTIAALSATLELYMDLDKAVQNIPTLKMMALSEKELLSKANKLKELISEKLGNKCAIEVIDELDEVGGGSLPGVTLNGKAVALTAENMNVNVLQEKLRKSHIPIICRINKDRISLNVRTIHDEEFEIIVNTLWGIIGE